VKKLHIDLHHMMETNNYEINRTKNFISKLERMNEEQLVNPCLEPASLIEKANLRDTIQRINESIKSFEKEIIRLEKQNQFLKAFLNE